MARNVAGTALPVRTNDLLERVSELGSLKGSLDEMRRNGRGQVVLVAGEAGVGKPAVLERSCDQASREVRIIRGACDPLFTPRPLGPLYVAVEGGLERFIGTGATPHEVVPALTRELASRGPSVFVLEDLHWADEATLDVLLMLVRRVRAIPALVPATYRDDARGAAQPLGKTSPRRRGGGAAAGRAVAVELHGGEGLDALDECVSSGMIVPDTAGVAFRHELARLAVEGSLGLGPQGNPPPEGAGCISQLSRRSAEPGPFGPPCRGRR